MSIPIVIFVIKQTLVMMEKDHKEYIAFISYKREDEEWAKWLQKRLEHYKLPARMLHEHPDLPKEIRPVFKDTTEFASGVLEEEIYHSLQNSKFLIVLCSPLSAKSPWVAKEISTFIDLGKKKEIIPFIIDGVPHSTSPETECFPEPLRQLPANEELIGINVGEVGREQAAIKVIAQMFGLKFDSLWNRHEREKRRKRILWGALLLALALSGLGVGAYIAHKNAQLNIANRNLEEANERILRERDRANTERDRAEAVSASLRIANDSILNQREIILKTNDNLRKSNWSMLANQSRAVAEKAMNLIDEGDSYLAMRLALEILPHDLETPDRPYVPQAEMLLRKAFLYNHGIIHTSASSASISKDGSVLATCSTGKTSGEVNIWDMESGRMLQRLDVSQYDNPDHPLVPGFVKMSPDGKQLFISSGLGDRPSSLWNIRTGSLEQSLRKDSPDDISRAASFSEDGLILAEGESKRIHVWNPSTGKLIRQIRIDEGELKNIAIDNGAKEIRALILSDGNFVVKRYDIGSGSEKGEIRFNHEKVKNFRWSVFWGAERFAAQAETYIGTRIWVFDVDNGKQVLYKSDTDAYSGSFSPSGNNLYVVGSTADGKGSFLTGWNVKSGTTMMTQESDNAHYSFIEASPSGESLALCGDKVQLLDIASSSMTNIPGGNAVVSPEGSYFATLDNGEILVHDAVTLKAVKRFPTSSMSRIAFSPDGNLIVQKIRLKGSRLPEHLIIDIKKDSVFESNDIPGYFYFDMFGRTPGTPLVKSSMAKKMIRSWDPQSFDPVCFSSNPRNNHLAVRLRQVTNHYDGFFQIWDMDKEEPLTPVIRAFDDEFGSISYSSDGKYLLTSESLILEPLSGKVIGVSDSPGGSYDFALSPDGKYIMKKLSDRVQLYDQASGYLVLEMQGARDIDFLPDCKHIIVSSDDETWVVDFPELSVLLKRTRERFKGTPLTLKERREYFLSEGITE